jgi:hypothetical protein
VDWLELLNLELEMEVGVLLILELDRKDSGHLVNIGETKHWATVVMKAIDQFWDFWVQFYWSRSSRLELRFMPSSLEADEVRDYFFSAWRVILMRISDRVARGENLDFSCLRCIDTYIVRSFLLLFFW